MVKKILYLILVAMIGFLVYYVDFQNVQYKYTLSIVETAIENKEYPNVGKVFCGLFDSKSIIENDGTDKADIVIYPGTSNTKIEYGDKNDPDTFIKFERAYIFYLFNSSLDLATYTDVEEGTNMNASGIKFISENKEYYYYFVVDSTINTEYYQSNPNEVVEAMLNDSRDYSETYKSLGFISISFTETIIKEIVRILGEPIQKFQFVDAKGTLVTEQFLKFDYSEKFFLDNTQIINDYNDCYDRLKAATGDKKLSEEINNEFTEKYNKWKEDFEKANHPTYTLGFDKEYLNPSNLYTKTLGTLAIYLLIAIALYIFFFYRKNVKYLFCKIFKIDIHEEDNSPIKSSPEDEYIDVGGGPLEEQPTRLRREMFIKKEETNKEKGKNEE